MCFSIYSLLGLFVSGLVHAAVLKPDYIITKKNLQTHVNFFTSPALEGRMTGSIGEQLATQYIANIFLDLGLAPAGDHGTFFQEFEVITRIVPGKNNVLMIKNGQGLVKSLRLGKQWQPLSYSDTVSFENGALVFAGFGITAPAQGILPAYNSYKGLKVKNKWVLVFRDMPEPISAQQHRQISAYASLRYKTFTAKNLGAKGIIFVNAPNATGDDKLPALSVNSSLANSGIVALSFKKSVVNDLLKNNGTQCTSLRKLYDNLHLCQLSSMLFSNIRITGQVDLVKNIQHGRNVLAKLTVSPDSPSMIVVGAHVDHLGHGTHNGSLNRNEERGMIHPGADDNASGVASILEVAARLSQQKREGRLQGTKDILFAAWSGEELGILGSSHFVTHFMKNAPDKLLYPTIETAINLDMVGHLRAALVLQGVGSSPAWPRIIKGLKMKHALSSILQNDPYLPTDSTSFYVHGVPILNLFTGAHDGYHTSRDTPEKLNYAGIKKISEFLVDLLLELEKQPQAIHYKKVVQRDHTAEREFKIYLGTIPDYAGSEISGVKLSGVTKNSPAEQAGVQQGDIIIQLAKHEIHDIYDYTYALNALPVKTPVRLVVLRGKKHVALTIIAQYRE